MSAYPWGGDSDPREYGSNEHLEDTAPPVVSVREVSAWNGVPRGWREVNSRLRYGSRSQASSIARAKAEARRGWGFAIGQLGNGDWVVMVEED